MQTRTSTCCDILHMFVYIQIYTSIYVRADARTYKRGDYWFFFDGSIHLIISFYTIDSHSTHILRIVLMFCIYVYRYIHMYVFMYVCVYFGTHTQTHTHTHTPVYVYRLDMYRLDIYTFCCSSRSKIICTYWLLYGSLGWSCTQISHSQSPGGQTQI